MSRDLVDEYESTDGEPNLQRSTGKLIVPVSFTEWCTTLPPNARQRLSIHELRQIWETLHEGLRLVLPYLDVDGVFHRHNGVDFPNHKHCPYCELDELRAELAQARADKEAAEAKAVDLQEKLEVSVHGHNQIFVELGRVKEREDYWHSQCLDARQLLAEREQRLAELEDAVRWRATSEAEEGVVYEGRYDSDTRGDYNVICVMQRLIDGLWRCRDIGGFFAGPVRAPDAIRPIPEPIEAEADGGSDE